MRTILTLGSVLLAAGASAATFTVTSTADSGPGSLRQAILDANANAGTDTIAFAIPGAGVHTISPVTALANITQPVTIDGYTQPGSAVNTDPIAHNAVLLIELEGSGSSAGSGLKFNAGSQGSTLRGLVLNRWSSANIELNSASNTVSGCFLGTDPTGLSAPTPLTGTGVYASGASNTIGGAALADRNLISGNQDGVEGPVPGTQVLGNLIGVDVSGEEALPNLNGVHLSSFGVDVAILDNVISSNTNAGIIVSGGGVIQGNRVGLSASGTKALGNGGDGVSISSEPSTLGGPGPGEGNVISANGGIGVNLSFSSDVVVQGNFIGTDATGALPFGNGTGGIRCVSCTNSVIGGTNAGEGNIIAFNGANGVSLHNVPVPAGNVIRGNSIHSNGPTAILPSLTPLAIDLGLSGPNPNDPGDADTGPNQLQNSPHVSSAAALLPSGSGTHVQGVLHSTPNTEYTLDFYSNPACAPRPRAFLQARTYLGSGLATADGSGDAAFDIVVPGEIAPGEPVTATATDPAGNTSEVSARIVYTILPGNGPAAGGTNVTLSGSEFESGASVTVGGQPATNVVVVDGDTITATAPALPAGSVGDVTVANPSGLGGTYARGWVSDFLDAGDAGFFYPYVVTLVGNGVTAGCGGGNYCPNAEVTRAQMAAFLLKAKHGLCYVPPACAGMFPDVACPSLFANWIEALAAEGITGGCGGGNYCPGNIVRRDQMAAFLLKAEHGSTYAPPPCQGVFLDVPCPSQFAAWVEQLAAENITGGCGGDMYCPSNPNTRGQMAVFITKTFNLR
ncbi:MAG: S-layer homology domain-containing protein [Thermoanaerobaculia bacterium]